MKKGQALITLVVFTVVAMSVISVAVSMLIINGQSASDFQEGSKVYAIAESGMENALIEILRNPHYSGETMTVNSGTAVITVTGTNPKTVTSEGVLGNFKRKIQTTVTTTNGISAVSAWKEVYN